VEILGALKSIDSFGCVDRIDRLCENLIVESLISAASPPQSDDDRAISNIRAYLESHYRESIDFNALAESQGLSPSDFRRKWGAKMHVAPGEFVGQLRIREASRLLVESEKNVKEIAVAVGYSDPLYFSRRFRQITGESATEYRKGVETP
jgi:transcriptional regulator GlxA family with amidase domain